MEVATGAGATVGSLVEAARGRWERWRRGAAISAGLVVAASAGDGGGTWEQGGLVRTCG